MTQKIELKLTQSQSLVMTPQLQQAIKILQLSNMELQTFIGEQLLENPLLMEGEAKGTDEGIPEDPSLGEQDSQEWEKDSFEAGAFGESGLSMSHMKTTGSSFEGSEDTTLQRIEDHSLTLRDHLMAQLHTNGQFEDSKLRLMGQALIDLVEYDGYLRESLEGVADQLGCPLNELNELRLMMADTFDPAGVFAQNLSECLEFQLHDQNDMTPAYGVLLKNLDLLASGHKDKLEKLCEVTPEVLLGMIQKIKTLNPKPGLEFDHTLEPPTVIPEVIVRPEKQSGHAGWAVELNASTLPKVLINQDYFQFVKRNQARENSADYIQEKLNSANWLIKSLHQRATSILRVASEIVRQQEAFLNHGIQYMRPLVLKDIAEKLGLHESTISRVTTNKYMATPRGIFEMKYFFNASIISINGAEGHSSESVRYRIKKLIEEEDPKAPLSDDQLVDVLKGQGVHIARRTIAKYRDSLNIPSSFERKRRNKI